MVVTLWFFKLNNKQNSQEKLEKYKLKDILKFPKTIKNIKPDQAVGKY